MEFMTAPTALNETRKEIRRYQITAMPEGLIIRPDEVVADDEPGDEVPS